MFVVVLLLVGVSLFFILRGDHHHKNSSTMKFTHLSIVLSNGKPLSAPSTYLVKPGVGLEFSIESNVFGKVGVPTNPPQTITFTQSPLVFKLKAPTKPGTYPLSYQADNSQSVIEIGTIVVK